MTRLVFKRLFGLLMVCMVLIGVLTPAATFAKSSQAAAPLSPAHRTFSFVVRANQPPPGLDTGINLAVSTHIIVEAQGKASYGFEGTANCFGTPLTNPDGQRFLNGKRCPLKIDPNAILPSAPIGELIASVGQPGTPSSTGWFAIGKSYEATIFTPGRLFLLYNDVPGLYGDNSGHYHVTVKTHLIR